MTMCIPDELFPGLVKAWTELLLPPGSMTQLSTLKLSSWGPLFIMSQKASYTCAKVAPPRESPHPPILLINEHVQSAHCVSLKPDHINQGLNFKGQVPSPATWEKNMELLKTKGPHTAHTLSVLIHLTPHFCWRTTHRSVSPRPHSWSHKTNKRPRKTSHQVLARFDRTSENHTPVTPQAAK